MPKPTINDETLWDLFCEKGRDVNQLQTALHGCRSVTFKERSFTNVAMFLLDADLGVAHQKMVLNKMSSNEIKSMSDKEHQGLFFAMIDSYVNPGLIQATIEKGFKPGAVSAKDNRDALSVAFKQCESSTSAHKFNFNYRYIQMLLRSGEIHDFPDKTGIAEADKIRKIYEKDPDLDPTNPNDLQRYLAKYEERQCQSTVILPKRTGTYPIAEMPLEEASDTQSEGEPEREPDTNPKSSFCDKLFACLKGKNDRVGP